MDNTYFLNLLLFAVFPYVSLAIFFIMTIQRYRTHGFSYSSLSSQFLENRHHFWGLIPFHYGIIVVFFGHLIAFLIPRSILLWNSQPLRLYILEITGLVFALLTIIGLVSMTLRRLFDPKIKIVTSTADWILFSMLFVQIFSGVFVAMFHGWGSSWFASSASPYLWSILMFGPDISYIVAMPWMVKLHIIGAYVMIAAFPFTRLVHILVVPNQYLWRKPQVVRWYRKKMKVAQTNT